MKRLPQKALIPYARMHDCASLFIELYLKGIVNSVGTAAPVLPGDNTYLRAVLGLNTYSSLKVGLKVDGWPACRRCLQRLQAVA